MSTLDTLNDRDDGQEPEYEHRQYTPSTAYQALMCCAVCAFLIALFLVVSGLVLRSFGSLGW